MRLLDALALYTEGLPRDSFDPQAVLSDTGADAEVIFAWVRDHTALVAYGGRLRGAAGVLADRKGNSLDRALLLAALLREAGHGVRLARGALAAADAEALLAVWRGRPDPAPAIMPDAEVQARLIEALDAEGFATAWMPAWLDEQAQRRAQAAAELERQSAALADALLSVVAPALRPDAAADARQRLALMADHWWVQIRQGDLWLDLDPADPDAAPGEALTAAVEVFLPDELPAALDHSVTFRIVAERLRAGALEQLTLLERSVAAAEGPTLRFALAVLPMGSAFVEQAPEVATHAQDMLADALAEREWLPVLFLGEELVIWRFADIDGEIFDSNDMALDATRLGQGIARMTEEGLGGALDLLGGLPTGAEDEPAAGAIPALSTERALTALWLEIELRGPGREARLERRTLFDLLQGLPAEERNAGAVVVDDAAHRARALGLLGTMDGLVAFAAPDDLYVAHAGGSHWLAQRTAFGAAFRAAAANDLDGLLAATGALDPWPASLFSFAQLRARFAAAGGYLDAPLVVAAFGALADGADGTLVASAGIDIVAAPAGRGEDGADALRHRVRQGVFDTLLEARLLEAGLLEAEEDLRNAALLSLATDPKDWRLVPPAGPDDPLLVVVGEAAGRDVVWWRVDPRSGETLGVDAQGRGSVVFEYVMTKLNIARESMVHYRVFGCIVAAKVATVTLLLALLSEGSDAGDAIYGVTRGAVKQAACFFSAVTFGAGPGVGLYGAGATVGLVNVLESVGSFAASHFLGGD